MSQRVFIGLGSNLGDPVRNIQNAVDGLGAIPELQIGQLSPLYLSPPLGSVDQPDYINAVLELFTEIPPSELLKLCKNLEARLGRTASEHWGPRLIDLDILLYGQQIIDLEDLQVPHSGIAQRNFVLYPLADIDPHLEIPGLAKLAVLTAELEDSKIRRL